ncbi:Ig-like domain-containing protein, partial [Acinetobacter sp. YH12154]|uniref:Ig-like domain-containing protein n=2 Tax=unclassified Acinetobacter TaxID=196816 RepID=UPI0015D27891
AAGTTVSAVATFTDAAGNSATANASRPYTVDTSAPVVVENAVTIDVIAGDDVINNAESTVTQTVTGTVNIPADAASTTVKVTVNGVAYDATVDVTAGTWTLDVAGKALAAGTTVSAVATFTDAAGNSATANASRPYTVDTSAPVVVENAVTFKENVASGTEIYDVDNNATGNDEDVKIYEITTGNEDGIFIIDPITGKITIAEGKTLDYEALPNDKKYYALGIKATDAAGNSDTAVITVNVENTQGEITTSINSDGLITGTTEFVIAGSNIITLKITGLNTSGESITITRTVDLSYVNGTETGSYSYQLLESDGIVDGSAITVEAHTIDIDNSNIYAYNNLSGYTPDDPNTPDVNEYQPGLDLVKPTIAITTVGNDWHVVWSDTIDADFSKSTKQPFTVTGTSTGVEAGQEVSVTFANTSDGQAITVTGIVQADGIWSATVTAQQAAKLLDGTATATVRDHGDNTATSEVASYVVDAPLANVTHYYDDIDSVQNTVTTFGVLSDVSISSKVTVAWDSNAVIVEQSNVATTYGTFSIDANGNWTYKLSTNLQSTLDLTKAPLTDIISVTDSLGKAYEVKVSINENGYAEGWVGISATTASLSAETNIASDGNTFTIYSNDSLGRIEGTVASGVEKVRIYINKQDTSDNPSTLPYPKYLEVNVDTDGHWIVTEAELQAVLEHIWEADQLNNDNIYIQVRAIDPVTGKVGEVSTKYTFVVDTIAPEATNVSYDETSGKVSALVYGDSSSTKHANTGDKVIVTYKDAEGKEHFAGEGVVGNQYDSTNYLNINIQLDSDVKTVVDTNTQFVVYVTDRAGNTGTSNDKTIDPTLVLPTPVVDGYIDDVGAIKGTINANGVTDDQQGQITGTINLTAEQLALVDEVRIYLYNNTSKWISIPVAELVSTGNGNYRWTTNVSDLYKVTTTGTLAPGEVTIKAATYNEATGVLGGFSPIFKFTVDVTPPTIEITSVAEDEIISQAEKTDGFTIKGTTSGAEEGQTVTIKLKGTSFTGIVGSDGTWSISLTAQQTTQLNLQDGQSYTVSADVSDKAGNPATPATKDAVVNAAPTASTTPLTTNEDVAVSGKITGVDLTGDTLSYTVKDGAGSQHGGTVVLDSVTGNFTYTPAPNWSSDSETDVDSFVVVVKDQYGNSVEVTQNITVTAVADTPTTTETMDYDVESFSMNMYTWTGIKSIVIDGTTYNLLERRGSGATNDTLVKALNYLYENRAINGATVTHAESFVSTNLPTYNAVFITGYLYLEKGQTYQYTGKADDSGTIIIGDESSYHVNWSGVTSADASFVASETGFYTFKLYLHNADGVGNYNFQLKHVLKDADGNNIGEEAVKYFSDYNQIIAELPDFMTLKPFNDTANEDKYGSGNGYYGVVYGYSGAETDQISLNKIEASLTDRDGSEILSMTMTGLAAGTILTYSTVNKDGTIISGKTSVANSSGEIMVTGDTNIVEFTDMKLQLPVGVTVDHTYQVTMNVTATETEDNSTQNSTFDFSVVVTNPNSTIVAKIGDDIISTGTTGNDTLIYNVLAAADAKAGHGIDTWTDFHLGNPSNDTNADTIKFASDFFSGLTQAILDTDNASTVGKFISVNSVDGKTTISIDRNGDVDGTPSYQELLVLNNTNTTLQELLENNQIIIG